MTPKLPQFYCIFSLLLTVLVITTSNSLDAQPISDECRTRNFGGMAGTDDDSYVVYEIAYNFMTGPDKTENVRYLYIDGDQNIRIFPGQYGLNRCEHFNDGWADQEYRGCGRWVARNLLRYYGKSLTLEQVEGFIWAWDAFEWLGGIATPPGQLQESLQNYFDSYYIDADNSWYWTVFKETHIHADRVIEILASGNPVAVHVSVVEEETDDKKYHWRLVDAVQHDPRSNEVQFHILNGGGQAFWQSYDELEDSMWGYDEVKTIGDMNDVLRGTIVYVETAYPEVAVPPSWYYDNFEETLYGQVETYNNTFEFHYYDYFSSFGSNLVFYHTDYDESLLYNYAGYPGNNLEHNFECFDVIQDYKRSSGPYVHLMQGVEDVSTYETNYICEWLHINSEGSKNLLYRGRCEEPMPQDIEEYMHNYVRNTVELGDEIMVGVHPMTNVVSGSGSLEEGYKYFVNWIKSENAVTGIVDADQDGIADICDNCPTVNNNDQTNSDGDKYGDACDNCVQVNNPTQIDSDHDGYGNECDNCEYDYNPQQEDYDGNAVGDACDEVPIVEFSKKYYGVDPSFYAIGKQSTPDKMKLDYEMKGGRDGNEHNVQIRWCDCSETGAETDAECIQSNCRESVPEMDIVPHFEHAKWHLISYTNYGNVETLHVIDTSAVPYLNNIRNVFQENSRPVNTSTIYNPTYCETDVSEWSRIGHDDLTDLDTFHCEPQKKDYEKNAAGYAYWNWADELWWQFYLDLDEHYEGGFIDKSEEMARQVSTPFSRGHYWGRFWIRPELLTTVDNGSELINDYATFILGEYDDSYPDVFWPENWMYDPIGPYVSYEDKMNIINIAHIGIKDGIVRLGTPAPNIEIYTIPIFAPAESLNNRYLYEEEFIGENSAIKGLILNVIDGSSMRSVNTMHTKTTEVGGQPNTIGFATTQYLTASDGEWTTNVAVFGGELANGYFSNDLWIGRTGNRTVERKLYTLFQKETPNTTLKPAPRKQASIVNNHINRQLVVFGGELEDGAMAEDLWIYDLGRNQWYNPQLTYDFISGSKMITVQSMNKVFILGGNMGDDAEGNIYSFDFNSYEPEILTRLQDGPGFRTNIAVDFVETKPQKIVVYGGKDPTGMTHNDLWVYDLENESWSILIEDCNSDYCPSPSERATVRVDKDGSEITVYPRKYGTYSTYWQTDTELEGAWVSDKEINRESIGKACILGDHEVKISNRANVTSSIISNGIVKMEATSILEGNIETLSSVFLGENARVAGSIKAGTIITKQNGVTVGGWETQGALLSEQIVEEKEIEYGTEDIYVDTNHSCDRSLAPGNYNNIYVQAGCSLTVVSGDYNVREIIFNPEAELIVFGNVRINAGNKFVFGDRAVVSGLAHPSFLKVYTNQTSPVYFGVDSIFIGYVEAPFTMINIAPNGVYYGCVQADRVNIEADAIFNGFDSSPIVIKDEETEILFCGNGTIDPGEECDDGNFDNRDDCLNSCEWPTCDDGFEHLNLETDVDCGGDCPPCADGLDCIDDYDCESGHCLSGTCVTPPPNTPPVVNAGVDKTITLPATASITATAADDGQPNPTLALAWSKTSGPGTATFSHANGLTTAVSFSVSGTYVLRLTASDGALTGFDEVQITVNPAPNTPPVVNAGTDRTITLPATASITATATDDGKPNPTLSLSWTKTSGPGTATFSPTNALTTVVSFSVSGTYVLRLTASDGALTGFDEVQVTVNPVPNTPPVVNAGADKTITLPATASITATATDDGKPNPTLSLSWTKTSGPGTATFSPTNALTTVVSFSVSGTYVLRLTASDGALKGFHEVQVTVNPVPNAPPVVNAGVDKTITLPSTASITATATDDGKPNPTLSLSWTKTSGPGTATFTPTNALTTVVSFSVSGIYVLRLTANDGALTAFDEVQVTVNPASGTTPCTGLCGTPTNFTINGTYQSGNLGTGAVCRQTTSIIHGGNCNNLVSPRTLSINGTTMTCNGANWASIPAARNGGYCVQTTAGNQSFASFSAW